MMTWSMLVIIERKITTKKLNERTREEETKRRFLFQNYKLQIQCMIQNSSKLPRKEKSER